MQRNGYLKKKKNVNKFVYKTEKQNSLIIMFMY